LLKSPDTRYKFVLVFFMPSFWGHLSTLFPDEECKPLGSRWGHNNTTLTNRFFIRARGGKGSSPPATVEEGSKSEFTFLIGRLVKGATCGAGERLRLRQSVRLGLDCLSRPLHSGK
jgi:hypothetical protein